MSGPHNGGKSEGNISDNKHNGIKNHPKEIDILYTNSGIPIEFIYNKKSHIPNTLSGVYPYTRGIHPYMYRSKLWSVRQYSGFGSASDSNARLRYLLNQRQNALSVAFDLPTQIGYDSDHPFAEGEVGNVGVAIDTLQDMEMLFNNIPLEKVSTSMTINAPAAILFCMYVATAEKRGISPTQLSGTIQNDILKEYVARGTYIYPPKASIRLATNLITYINIHFPKFHPISISGYHIREAGSTAIQEVAFAFANAKVYLDEALKQGEIVDHFAQRLSFFFSADNDFFEEVAKFRAARRIWAKIMKEHYHAKMPKSWQLRFHTQTAGSRLTSHEPDNNIVRVTIQALAAVLGGTQSLHTNSKDEALALPTEDSVRIALRTQQIIAEESGVIKTVDPLGGSYFVEYLTDEIEAGVVKLLDEIEQTGGMIKAIETGFIQREINVASYQSFRQTEEKKQKAVASEGFSLDNQMTLHENNPLLEKTQIHSLNEIKLNRDNLLVSLCLDNLRKASYDEQANLIPFIMEAVKAYCTVEEISNVFRTVFGEFKEGNPNG
ncbi:methylmalonyl-CoA mutase [Aquibacillus halophilus]|uniref:Methylmalonyl-CoA mutase n=1 Tax=Aquibacillus halophilus TaxID=930132 RepID=A0A6A8D8Q0_9BACI|nr:methylmalonyl-CoA mutase family protein [Aquibacillus halophilus]MRH42135.1 methylmalonyl-CoA mutase [Aquibacillus halophilus]